ncbi:MAG: hypothetical protein VX741_10975 [Pseudomonadota bacterium]|nr:hypothetical protein [Pseudomonadota bacterium]
MGCVVAAAGGLAWSAAWECVPEGLDARADVGFGGGGVKAPDACSFLAGGLWEPSLMVIAA